MIEVQTDHPVATWSLDHTHPMGTAHDNSINLAFNDRLFRLFKSFRPSVLDLGCAGGGFVASLLGADCFAIGIEGSDYSQRSRRAAWATNSGNLFTADITEPFQVRTPGMPCYFSVVTAWEVLEHIPEDNLKAVFANVRKHLVPAGLFIVSISTITATGPGQDVEYHQTIRPAAWWLDRLEAAGFKERSDLTEHFSSDWVRGPNTGLSGSACFVLELSRRPRVSVVTPTWHRHQLLLDRCIPSIWAQEYDGAIEHVVVSGPDSALKEKLAGDGYGLVRYHELQPNVSDGGAMPRGIGAVLAESDLIAYLDDDNAWRPIHLSLLVDALEFHPEADFAYSSMLRHPIEDIVGTDPPAYCQIDTSLIVHRKQLLERGMWQPPGHCGAPDWEIVERWMQAGALWVHVPVVTVDYWMYEPGGSRA